MKSIKNKLIALVAVAGLALAACEKAADLPYYNDGAAVNATSSSATFTPVPADSSKDMLTFTWTSPNYATDSNRYKYLVQIDSASRNFSKAVTREVTKVRSMTFKGKDFNDILLSLGFQFNKTANVQVRVVSSYANNNEQLTSNVITIAATPYKTPPKVQPPTTKKLFIVGDATDGSWSNPVPVPYQEFTQIDSVNYGGIFYLYTNGSYLLLPENGSWASKYCVTNGLATGIEKGGEFVFRTSGGDNIPAPKKEGWYRIMVNFQTGIFTVTEFTQQHGLPANLFIVGDATPGSWSNPVPVPSQQFTQVNSTKFELTLNLTQGKKYLFLPENGSWGKKFGAVNGSAPNIKLGGPFKPEGEDMPSPDVTGSYKITVDFINNSYVLVKL